MLTAMGLDSVEQAVVFWCHLQVNLMRYIFLGFIFVCNIQHLVWFLVDLVDLTTCLVEYLFIMVSSMINFLDIKRIFRGSLMV